MSSCVSYHPSYRLHFSSEVDSMYSKLSVTLCQLLQKSSTHTHTHTHAHTHTHTHTHTHIHTHRSSNWGWSNSFLFWKSPYERFQPCPHPGSPWSVFWHPWFLSIYCLALHGQWKHEGLSEGQTGPCHRCRHIPWGLYWTLMVNGWTVTVQNHHQICCIHL